MLSIIKKILVGILLILLIVVGCIVFMYAKDNLSNKDNIEENNVIIEIEQGESISSIATKLKNEGILKYPKLFIKYGGLKGKSANVKFGLHVVNESMTYEEIYESISSSEMSSEIYNKVTIPEGFTINQIAERLHQNDIVDKDKFLELVKEGDFDFWFLNGIDVGKGNYKLEGFMYPQTYYIEKTATEEEVIEMFLNEFAKHVDVYKDKYTSKEFYDILKVASIVERETFIDAEKDIVSGVFYNRLNKGTKLESCATVEYVLNTRKKVLSYEDISIDSPYNTYKVLGLPPTPISNPSIDTIQASENPTKTDYMFFVANKNGEGHVFSKTYEEHLSNINKYR